MALTVCTWLWGDKYPDDYAFRLARGVWRNMRQPCRFIVIRDRAARAEGLEGRAIPDLGLLSTPGCFARLRMFDRDFQRVLGVHGPDDRLVCLDLDTVVTGPLDDLFDRPEEFLILQGANAANPCPFNGSVMMLRGGAHPDVWRDFSLDAARRVPFHSFPDDQGWLWHKLPAAAGWQAGAPSGIYAFRKPGWPNGFDLPADAKLVTFPGSRDPKQFAQLPWVRQRWI